MSKFGDPEFFGDRYAHEYDGPKLPDPAPAVVFLAELVPDGERVLELAIGTGRVAIHLPNVLLSMRAAGSYARYACGTAGQVNWT